MASVFYYMLYTFFLVMGLRSTLVENMDTDTTHKICKCDVMLQMQ